MVILDNLEVSIPLGDAIELVLSVRRMLQRLVNILVRHTNPFLTNQN